MTWRRPALATALAALASLASLASLAAGCGDDDDVPSDEPAGLDAGDVDTSRPSFDAGLEPAPGPRVECAIGSAVETEPNDTAATATGFSELSICGVLGTAKDVDFLTFTTPPGTTLTLFQAVIDGKVDFELTLGGATFGPSETSKFGPGTYLVKAFTKGTQPASYRVRVQFE